MENLFETLGEILKPEPAILNKYSEQARRAHYWTSHWPERLGDNIIKDYSAQLESDIKELEENKIEIETIESYKSRYENLFSSWLGAKGRCISSFITGPAKFPIRKAEKANRSEERHYEVFQEWRTRAKKAIIRKAQPVKTFVSEIDRYKSELGSLKKNHEKMKEGNKRIKQAGKTGENINQYLTDTFGIQPHMIDWTLKFGFGLQNNNANIKRIEERIKALEQKEEMLSKQPVTKYSFEGGEFIINYEIDRIQVFFNSRPTSEELMQWKDKGLSSFNWSPSASAWQRKITPNAMYSIKRMFNKITKL